MESPYASLLNPVTRFFSIIHLYTKTSQKPHEGLFQGVDVDHTLYEAKIESEYPGIIIVDTNQSLNPKTLEATLEIIEKNDKAEQYVTALPTKVEAKIIGLLDQNSIFINTKDEEGNKKEKIDLATPLVRHNLIMKPKPRLRDLELLRDFDWPSFINKLNYWDAPEKDVRLQAAHKAFLLKGVEPRANPHGIICTPGGTGKSIHFLIHGINYDKVKKNSFLGFAKSPQEIFKGTVDGSDLPTNIDQIEIGEWGIIDYMFNIMEYGEARISSGSVDIPIKSRSPFVFSANPIGDIVNPEQGFGLLLSHLTPNPAIGRRIGVFIYSSSKDDYTTLKNKSTEESLRQWKEASRLFRAVEEAAKPELENIYRHTATWTYLNSEINGYSEQVKQLTGNLTDDKVKRFLNEHGGAGQGRIRAAALSATLVDHLKDIALKQYSLEEILQDASELVTEYASINLQSIVNLVKNLDAEMEFLANAWMKQAPEYQKEIVYCVEYQRRCGLIGNTFMLNNIEYTPTIEGYTHIGQCIGKLLKRKGGLAEFSASCGKFFGFIVKPVGKDLQIILSELKPLGFVNVSHISQFSRFPNVERDTVVNEIYKHTDDQPSDSTPIQVINPKPDQGLESLGNGKNGKNGKPLTPWEAALTKDAENVMNNEENSCGALRFYSAMSKLGYNEKQVQMVIKNDPRFKIDNLTVNFKP